MTGTVRDHAAPLTIRLFGPFDARLNGVPLSRLRSRKGYWLLALLVLRHGRDVDRIWLAGTLWPESPERQALASLRNCLTDLRSALGEEAERLRSPTAHTLSLNLEGADVDVVTFDAAIARGDERSLEDAVSLYRGPLLEGCGEEWAFQEQRVREPAYLRALETLAARAKEFGRHPEAERYLRLAVAVDPLRETAQRALMEILAATGSYNAATEAYRELCGLLERRLSAQPAAETSALFQQIRTEARRRALRPGSGMGKDVPVLREGSGVEGQGSKVQGERPSSASDPRPLTLDPSLNPRTPEHSPSLHPALEPEGGAVPLDSKFWVVRPTEHEFREAIARRDSIILVKGARQMGKTSLLGRGLQQASESDTRVVWTDFQQLNAPYRESAETLFLALASAVADQLDLDVLPDDVWNRRFAPSMNFTRYLRREVLGKVSAPIVWGLDEVDVLFGCEFGGEVFALFRSWHNQRVTDPTGVWDHLTLAIAYATEAHLLITDVNQSPFNVGTRINLEDFTFEQVADLNRRYDSPLKESSEETRFYQLLGGHPYLIRCGLHEMATRGLGIAAIEAQADRDDGPFGDHLRRILLVLAQNPDLMEVVRGVLRGQPCPTPESFYRLRSAGVLAGASAHDVRLRCQLYATYLSQRLL